MREVDQVVRGERTRDRRRTGLARTRAGDDAGRLDRARAQGEQRVDGRADGDTELVGEVADEVDAGLVEELGRDLDERAEQRGRRIEVAIRVDENALACRLNGFDVETWLAEDLLDMLILSSGTIDIEVEAFRDLVAGTHVQVHPCLYGWPSRYSPIPAALARGLAVFKS